MARGRKKLPTEIVRAHGGWRADYPHLSGRGGEPKIVPLVSGAPEWISEKARPYYDKFAALLSPMRVIGESDKQALAALADALADYVKYRSALDELEDHTIETKDGSIKNHPYVTARDRSWDRFFKGAREFGLNPSARAGVKTLDEEKKKDNGKDRFFQIKVV